MDISSLCCLVCIGRLFSLFIEAKSAVGEQKFNQVWRSQAGNVDRFESSPSRILIRVEGPTLATVPSNEPLVTTVSDDKEFEYCSLMARLKTGFSGVHVGRWMFTARHVCQWPRVLDGLRWAIGDCSSSILVRDGEERDPSEIPNANSYLPYRYLPMYPRFPVLANPEEIVVKQKFDFC